MITNGSVFIQTEAAIGYIIPDIVLEEIATDRTTTTENPIEVGTPSCDHAYRRPAEILMRVGWSNSTHQEEGYVQQIYATLIALKNSYQLIDVSTNKRQYENMLIESCVLRNNQETEYAAMCVVNCREILITSGDSQQASSATQADPSQTGPVANTAMPPGISQGIGSYNAAEFNQVGGLTATTAPALGSVPGGSFTGSYVPVSGYPSNVTGVK